VRAAGAALALMAVCLGAAGCSDRASGTDGAAGTPKGPAAPPAVPVGVATAEQRVVPVQVTAVGNVQAITTVGVKSQVAGQITQVHFAEGHEVRRGDLLFTIDPRPFEAALQQAQANVARDTAQLRQMEAAVGQRQAEIVQAQANLERDQAQWDMARVQETRYKDLAQKELVAREQYDQVRTNLAALSATVQADRAALENTKASVRAAEAQMENARAAIKADEALVEAARLQLAYTTIRSPLDGRTGNLLVQAGNVVKANEDNPMVVIAQVHPIYVSFAVPEQHLAAVKQYRAVGMLKAEVVPGDSKRPVSGLVTFVNNVVDVTTGTIQLKATFQNADSALWPGQFVDVSLTLTTENAIVVPTQAVQPGQQGPFVFVVKPDATVESRPVKPGRRLAREIVVEQGLKPGERVVTDGQLRLVPGARVEIKPQRAS
jgi:multidrug efflux system membrane fusion protein